MAKVSNKYLEVNPYLIIENGFHKDRLEVSESIFSLSNEFVGVRGFFEEGISLPQLIGTYFNGVIELGEDQNASSYKGVAHKTHFTLNSVNFFKCRIKAKDEVLDLAKSSFVDFRRTLDMRSGLYKREFVWNAKGTNVHITFERLLDMQNVHHAYQRITFKSDEPIDINLSLMLDTNVLHWGKKCYWGNAKYYQKDDVCGLSSQTINTKTTIYSAMKVDPALTLLGEEDKELSLSGIIHLEKNTPISINRHIYNYVKDENDKEEVILNEIYNNLNDLRLSSFDDALNRNINYFKKVYEKSDIIIEGNDLDQQGIRYCIFQLEQTYHGYSPKNNIGAKGLTGEAYSGHAFWDSETYCLPYYLFTNKEAAHNLLMFRYNTLEQAKARAKDLDCIGACYPIATRNGEEACTLWQHASCQLQPTSAVGYAIFHYMNIYHDEEFMEKYGLEMMLEICKFLYSRGQYDANNQYFGYYGVMGPDEFEMMVNHNTYTNYMGKKMFEYLFSLLKEDKPYIKPLLKKCGYSDELLNEMRRASESMLILYDDKTKLFEQHDGYFKLPHIDVDSIPVTDFPLYSHWAYDRIYRNDIIKQPDVLMFMFLYPHDFTYEQKKANYEFYEPRCIHESSLSPSIHSIFASELGKEEEALNFFSFATRLDLDDYNRNTREGLHMTSIAAAWMNIVYGFLGLKSDTPTLSIAPSLPKKWTSYSVNIFYQGSKINFKVYNDKVLIKSEKQIVMNIYNQLMTINGEAEIKR